jgi:divalent metal cation (Fe/Co/Zn/Cd) transporter
VYGLENLVDFISSCVVLWRFYAPASLDDTLEQKLKQREERASTAISFFMIALGLCILSAAVSDFSRGQEDLIQQSATLVLTFFSVLLFGTLSIIKFRYAAKLNSPSMYKDGICSVIGTFLGLALFLNTAIVHRNPNAWWIDPVAAFIAGIVAISLGIRAIWDAYTKEGLPIFSKSWWINGNEKENVIEVTSKHIKEPSQGEQTDSSDDDTEINEII